MNRRFWKNAFRVILAVVVSLIAAAALLIFGSRHNDLKLDSTPPVFLNPEVITRIDGSRLSVDSLESAILTLMKSANVYGLGVSITTGNKVTYQKYFGYKNALRNESFVPGTIFYGASLSKPILADIALQLVHQGILNLDTPIYRYLTKPLYDYKTNGIQRLLGANNVDYTELESDDRYKQITARMCLSHTSGLPNWRWLEEDRKLKFKSEPGSRYSYSGEGMYLLQLVLEELTATDFDDLARNYVFTPLKMSRSSFVWQSAYEGNYCVGHDNDGNNLRIPKSNSPNAAGSLSTTLEDYAIYVNAVLSLDRDQYNQMTTPQIRIRSRQQFGPNSNIDDESNDAIQLSYGLGVGLYQTPYGKSFFKEGHLEGWQHYVVGFPENGFALILMANSDNAESIYKEVIELATGNQYTPWYWEGYIPHNH